jgi:hypothetical protein
MPDEYSLTVSSGTNLRKGRQFISLNIFTPHGKWVAIKEFDAYSPDTSVALKITHVDYEKRTIALSEI